MPGRRKLNSTPRIAALLTLGCALLAAQTPAPQELEYLSQVVPLIQAGSLDEAQSKVQEGLKLFPHSAVLMNALGMTYERQGKKSDAIEAYRQAVDWLPSFAAAQLHLASLLAANGACDQAVPLFVSTAHEINDAGALSTAGLGLAQCQNYSAAADALERAHSLNPSADAVTFNLALARFQNHEMSSALETLNAMSQAESGSQPAVRFLRGKVMLALNQPGGTDLMASACRSQPAEDFCNDTAIALIRNGHFREAADLLLPSLVTLGDSAAIRSTLGLAQFRLGQYKDAIASYSKVSELDPGLSAPREGLGFLLYMTGDLEQARSVVEKALSASADDFYLHYLRALILYRQGRTQWAAALASLGSAVDRAPTFAPAYFLRGKILMEQENIEAALADFKTAVKLDSKYALPYYKMSQIYQRLGRDQNAEQARRRFDELGSRREEEVLAAQAQNQLLASH
jgi:tetratricopeptide (TPR) repeat protein